VVIRRAGSFLGNGPARCAGIRYWADSTFIASRGIPTVLSPGGEGAQTDAEWASITDTIDCTRILIEVTRSMEHR
jgi:hypothetical protein